MVLLCHSKMKFTDCFHPLNRSRDHSTAILELREQYSVSRQASDGPLAPWPRRETASETSRPKERGPGTAVGLHPPL